MVFFLSQFKIFFISSDPHHPPWNDIQILEGSCVLVFVWGHLAFFESGLEHYCFFVSRCESPLRLWIVDLLALCPFYHIVGTLVGPLKLSQLIPMFLYVLFSLGCFRYQSWWKLARIFSPRLSKRS
jgi:hypothetical protein